MVQVQTTKDSTKSLLCEIAESKTDDELNNTNYVISGRNIIQQRITLF